MPLLLPPLPPAPPCHLCRRSSCCLCSASCARLLHSSRAAIRPSSRDTATPATKKVPPPTSTGLWLLPEKGAAPPSALLSKPPLAVAVPVPLVVCEAVCDAVMLPVSEMLGVALGDMPVDVREAVGEALTTVVLALRVVEEVGIGEALTVLLSVLEKVGVGEALTTLLALSVLEEV